MAVPEVDRRRARRAAPWLVAVALGIVYVVWGSTYLGIRIVVEEADPLPAMGQRYAVSGVLLGAVLALRHGVGRLRLTRRQLAGTALLGLMLPLLGNGVVALAESRGVTSGYAALLIAVSPLAIVVFRVLERDRPRAMTLVGVLTGFGGLAVLVLLGRGGPGGVAIGPAVLVLLAGTCWALGSYLQPRLDLPADPFVVAVYEMAIGGVLLMATGMVVGQDWTLDYSQRTWLALGYLTVFGSVVAFSSYVWLVANAPISLVATYAYINPVIAVLLGGLVLDERISTVTLVGGAVVVASVAVVITSERVRPPP